MNERIKELAEQAGFYFYDMHDVNGEDLGETIEADSWCAAEKFTELIVRECMEACIRANDIRYFVPPTQEQVVLSCMREIETTFRS